MADDPETEPPIAGRVIDARGHHCPIPTLRLQRALRSAPPGSTLTLLTDDPLARIDVPHFAAAQGHEVLGVTTQGEVLHVAIRKRPPTFSPR